MCVFASAERVRKISTSTSNHNECALNDISLNLSRIGGGRAAKNKRTGENNNIEREQNNNNKKNTSKFPSELGYLDVACAASRRSIANKKSSYNIQWEKRTRCNISVQAHIYYAAASHNNNQFQNAKAKIQNKNERKKHRANLKKKKKQRIVERIERARARARGGERRICGSVDGMGNVMKMRQNGGAVAAAAAHK